MFKNRADLEAAIAKFGGDPTEAKMLKAAASILGCEDLLPSSGLLAKEAKTEDPAVATLKRENSVLKMSADHRSYFDGLETAQQDAFLAKSDADRSAEIAATKSADPVMYKCADGTEIRKSDGALALMMAKKFDAQDKRIDAILSKSSDDEFEKQAAREFGNLPTEGTVELLKAAAEITDDDKRKKMLDALRASNKAAGGRFRTVGSGHDTRKSATEGSDAEARLDALAKSRQQAKPDLSFEMAYDEVLSTREGRELYAEMSEAQNAD